MKRYTYLFALLLSVLLVLTACSSNKTVEEPVDIPPTPIELALDAADAAASAFEAEDYVTAMQYYNQAKDHYLEAQPTAAPTDSVDVNIEKIQINIAVTYARMAFDNAEAYIFDEAINEYESAANIYKSLIPLTISALQRDDYVANIYNNMAVASQKAGQYERALGYFDQVLQYRPGNADVLMAKYNTLKNDIQDQVRAYQVLKDYAEASQDYNAHLVLAQAYKEEGDQNTAAVYYDRAVQLAQNPDTYTRAANFYREIGNYSKSNELLNGLVEVAQDNSSIALAYRIMADNYDKLNNSNRKIEFYEKSLDLEPNADVALVLANHWNQQKNWDRVINYATRAINLDSSKAAAYLLRGVAHYQKKNYPSAKTDLQRIQNDPNYGSTARQLLDRMD